jgi:hypothetical protein
MKVQINSMDNGSGLNSNLEVWADYNPQNKVFNKPFCVIDEDDFLACFDDAKANKVFEQMQGGKIIFDVPKDKLIDNCKRLLN